MRHPLFANIKKILSVSCIVLVAIACKAQTTIKTGSPQNPSVGYKRLSNIDTLINGYVHRDWIKGAVTIVVKDGQVIQTKTYGLAMHQLRDKNISCEIYHEQSKFDKQFKYAERKAIPYIIIIGSKELESNTCTIKIIQTGNQQTLKQTELISFSLT